MHTHTYNIYCDESCHLEKDRQCVMVLGAILCQLEHTRRIADEIREIKKRHDLPPWWEIKWTKVTPSKLAFYHELVDYFFNEGELHFRALIAPKDGLPFEHGTHDDWYYEMYFDMLKVLIGPKQRYRIFIDIKDTRGGSKVRSLRSKLQKAQYEFKREHIECVQIVESDHIQQMQLADLLIGCVGYANRQLKDSASKLKLVEQLRERSGYSLTQSTLIREPKLNIFYWRGDDSGS